MSADVALLDRIMRAVHEVSEDMNEQSGQWLSTDPLRSRIEMTVSCRDSDPIPKTANAGKVIHERGRSVQVMHNGVRVKAGGYYGDWMTEIIQRLRGHHEPQEELVFYEILKLIPPRAKMLELGGFWSYYSLWFLNDAPDLRRSIVVEPDPHNLEVGRTNAEINGRQIEFIQACVGETSAEPKPFEAEAAGTIFVPQVCVSDLLEARGIGHLDILHCDTQGAEVAVIQSCEALLRERRIRFVVVSTHAQEISGDPLTHQRCLAMLQSFGGHILAEHDVHESFSGDGLIAAYFGAEPISWPELNLSYNRYSRSLFPNPIYALDEAQVRISALEEAIRQQEQLYSTSLRESDVRINALEGEVTSLQRRLIDAERDLQKAFSTVEEAALERDAAKAANAAILSSTSWVITAPLRVFAKALRRTASK
jgi:FkbM family methyltransferase